MPKQTAPAPAANFLKLHVFHRPCELPICSWKGLPMERIDVQLSVTLTIDLTNSVTLGGASSLHRPRTRRQLPVNTQHL